MAVRYVHAALLAAAMIHPVAMTAGTLGSVHISGFGLVIGRGTLPSQLPLFFGLSGDSSTPCWVPSSSCIPLLDQVLTPADVGSVFAFGPSNPGFSSVVGFLTDGIADEWSFALTSSAPGGVGISTSSMFPGGIGSDFAGSAISEIDLTLNDLAFSQVQLPVSNLPIVFGTFTQANLDVTISAQGTAIPEPRTVTFGIALIIFVAMKCFRRKLRVFSPTTGCGHD